MEFQFRDLKNRCLRFRWVVAIGSLLLALATATSQASGIVPTVSIGAEYHGYVSPEAACQAQMDLGLRTPITNSVQIFLGLQVRSWLSTGGAGTWVDGAIPYNTPLLEGWMCLANYQYNFSFGTQFGSTEWIWMYPVCPTSFVLGTYSIGSGDNYCPPVPMYFTTLKASTKSDNGPCCTDPGKALFADPINPATGNNTNAKSDLTASNTNELAFNRYYNSTDPTKSGLGTGWRGSFSRSIQANAKIASYQPLDPGAVNSSLYSDEATACTSGFAQIKSQVPNWALASASFSNGVCFLSQGGNSLGTLPIYAAYNYQTAAEASPPSFDVIRDDGQTIRFSVINGVITAPPSSSLKLQKTASGYTLSDANDNAEQYDTSGKLLSVIRRAGVVQAMSYDSSDRLSSVTDNFGHKLTLSYDAQGRLNGVTRQ